MKCKTLQEAKRIAYYGAMKMDAQGYQYSLIAPWEMTDGGVLRHGMHWVISPSDSKYRVSDSPFEEARTLECNCPFFQDNSVCKHTTRIKWMLTSAEATIRQQEEEDRLDIRIRDMEIGEADMEEARIRIGQWYGE